MSMTTDKNGTVLATGNGVTVFALMSQRMQLKLEAKGLKSSGGALRPRLAASLGLKPRDSHAKFITAIELKIQAIYAGQNI